MRGGAEDGGGFTLTVPSWVMPGTYAENIRFLADQKEIAGVELLFFLYNEELWAEFVSEWEEIASYRERFVFTAHLPEYIEPAHEELVARLSPLVRHFVAHPPRENPQAQAGLLRAWTEKYGALFMAENITPGLLEALLPHLGEGAGLCLDTGHLLITGGDPAAFFAGRRDRIGEIHLHAADQEAALKDGKLADHRRLRAGEPWLEEFLPLLKDYRGVVNLEMFSWEEIRTSIDVLRNTRLLR
ncbi:MAG: TIM barrel protein [Treponema sp.]|jgi:hypothetical protein|nr:TIM barrel protein [Treponema sp.]